MHKTIIAAALASALAVPALTAHAEDAPAAAAPAASEHTFTANVGIYSQYIFRGLTQTNEDPALQGGFDYSHASGLYAGVWASNISWLRDNNSYKGGGSGEFDFYAGFKNTIPSTDITYDLGVLQYWYPGSSAAGFVKADTTELYAALGWKWITAKYSHVVSDKAFGVRDADGTYYFDLSAAVPLGETGLTVGAHYGWQEFDGKDKAIAPAGVDNDKVYSYEDWRISLAYDLSKASSSLAGTEIGIMYTDTSSANKAGYGKTTQIGAGGLSGVYPKNIASDQVTVWLKRTF